MNGFLYTIYGLNLVHYRFFEQQYSLSFLNDRELSVELLAVNNPLAIFSKASSHKLV